MDPLVNSRHDGGLRRRELLRGAVAGAGALALGAGGLPLILGGSPLHADDEERPDYRGPNLIIIRFGGGVRRQEVIGDRKDCWSPYFRDELVPRGTLFSRMEIAQDSGQETSHGQGTLNILTGNYRGYDDKGERPFEERLEPSVPTLFEYMRRTYTVPEHQALIVNGEDRTQEEFHSFSNHHQFGIHYRSRTISLYRFKLHLLRHQLAHGEDLGDKERAVKQEELAKLEAIDGRLRGQDATDPHLEAFWEGWRKTYGDSGLRNPRGDRLLTELTARAVRELRPRLLIVNYQDPDYVHWGNANHYTWAIQIIDEGIRRLVDTVEADEEYRDNTVFCVVPDCGRDDNRFMAVPFQHHFGSRSARQVFALFFGRGVARGRNVARVVDQTQVAGTLARFMGVIAEHAEGRILEEAFA